MQVSDFGEDFIWGVSASAYQTEGAYLEDGKGLSIWDVFRNRKGGKGGFERADVSCNFYHRYIQDLILMEYLNIRHFRMSIAWSRILPHGMGRINEKGVDYYNQLIDYCLELNIQPWITLYHWDLPQSLEEKGGWTNRDVIYWFENFADICARRFGDRIRNWMVLNEPSVFTGAGYFLGLHAPGKKGLNNFLAATHHAALAQSLGARAIKEVNNRLQVGTTFSCSPVDPADPSEASFEAAQRVDAVFNRLFIEPLVGLGYPWKELKVLQQIEKFMKPGDEERLQFDMDFIGLQNYTREVVRYHSLIPYVNARLVQASRRKVPATAMDWEIYPAGIYRMLKQFDAYGKFDKIYITENGAAFDDKVVEGQVQDPERIDYFQRYLFQVLKAKKEGVPVQGYFAWSFTDNFEWAEGFTKRFGLVYIDYTTQQRIVKASGHWFRNFLAEQAIMHARAV